MEHANIMNTFARRPIAFTRGKGVYLYDENDKAYLDALSGIAVCGLGHAHKEITDLIAQQAGRLMHTSNGYIIREQHGLAETLCRLSGMNKVFFANSGAEANEAALKLSRLHARKKNIDHPSLIVMEHAFHGRTFGSMSATPNAKIQKGYQPLLEHFISVPFNNIQAIQAHCDNKNIVAVMLEVVQGEGGVYPADIDYLKALRRLCDEHGWLLIIDEIQAGMGRTGRWFAYQHADILPDITTMAKGLGNGFPIGACLARGAAAELFTPGSHGSTFGGNHLACAVASKVLDIYQRDHLVENAKNIGSYLIEELHKRFAGHKDIAHIRGLGLMIGIELKQADAQLIERAEKNGLIFNVTADKVIRLLPAMIYQVEHADELLDKLEICLSN